MNESKSKRGEIVWKTEREGDLAVCWMFDGGEKGQ